MHLEDVNIEGFKSFSEKTGMSFQPGIGVIIVSGVIAVYRYLYRVERTVQMSQCVTHHFLKHRAAAISSVMEADGRFLD